VAIGGGTGYSESGKIRSVTVDSVPVAEYH
jgi:hypothetical protein